MKKILVPTDFSANAKSSFEYALRLADKINALVEVVHFYHPTVQQVDGFLELSNGKLEESLREKMYDFIESCFDKSIEEILLAEMVAYQLELGFATDKIVEFSKSGEYDLIVMGATGTTGIFEKVFGKVSSHVAQYAKSSVILIPAGVSFEPIEEIMYASEYESVDGEILFDVEKFAKYFDANVHLVHVYDEDEKQPGGLSHFLLEKAFQIKAPSLKFTMESVTSDSVAHGLEKFAEEKEMDLMVLVKPKRKFWQRLIHKSETNSIIMNPQLPIMVMH
ncbi:MAG: universal stress protein [Saprospiraceae bacterium]